MVRRFPTCVVVLCTFMGLVWAAIEEDRVTNLPGLATQPSFKHYSGYLKATGTRHLHYWFVESQGNPSQDPVVLWLNGGPGCSSLDGLLTEHGPFLVVKDGLEVNPYSWNMVANMLYLEAPAGVGFSYTEDGNVTTGDDQVALDNHMALKDFMTNYPEFAQQDFYITGESYGGIYVPTLAARVVDDTTFKFKGFAVGNGLHNYDMNDNSFLYFLYYHGVMDTSAWHKIGKECCSGNFTDCNIAREAMHNHQCAIAANEGQQGLGDINIYNLYDECYTGPGETYDTRFTVHPEDARPLHRINKLPGNRNSATNYDSLPMKRLQFSVPCIDTSDETQYLNRSDVRTALHIPSHVPAWEICSQEVGMKYQPGYETMRSQYIKILGTRSHRILVYHGDVDMACNFLGGQWFVDSLHQKMVTGYKQWHYKAEDGSNQVAGFIKHFENLAFVTVKGAGHTVPQYKPIPSLDMFRDFLNGYS